MCWQCAWCIEGTADCCFEGQSIIQRDRRQCHLLSHRCQHVSVLELFIFHTFKNYYYIFFCHITAVSFKTPCAVLSEC